MSKQKSNTSLFEHDRELCHGTALLLCGIDEAGRGPLAGPVCAGAVVLPSDFSHPYLTDSKKLSEKKREVLFEELTAHAHFGVGYASVEEIEQHNILGATFLAMGRAYEELCAKLPAKPDLVLVDGNRPPPIQAKLQTLVGGDGLSACIAAASVIAKVSRDRYMLQLHEQYPQYGFAVHKGYGTKVHRQSILEHGPCPAHRMSFLGKILGGGV